MQWRHSDGISAEPSERAGVFETFQTIGGYNYFDLFASYNYSDNIKLTFGIDNLFEKEPPVVGNEAGDTSSNSGNTFPSNYDVLGRKFKMGIKFQF